MQLFVRVAELGSFAAVATQMGVARSVITRQIAALEAHLGTKLMVRTTRRLTLTAAGQTYLQRCRAILALVETAEAEVMEGRLVPRGSLRVGLPLSFGLKRLMPTLLAFAERYPEISLSLDFTDRQLSLIEEGFDLSLRITSRLQPGEVVRKLGESRLITVAAPAYVQQHGQPEHPNDLQGHACLGYSPQLNQQPWVYVVEGLAQNFYLPLRLQANNGDALCRAAVQGLGIALQPDFIVADYLQRGELVPVLTQFSSPPFGIYAVFPGNQYLPYRVRLLVEVLSQALSPSAAPVTRSVPV